MHPQHQQPPPHPVCANAEVARAQLHGLLGRDHRLLGVPVVDLLLGAGSRGWGPARCLLPLRALPACCAAPHAPPTRMKSLPRPWYLATGRVLGGAATLAARAATRPRTRPARRLLALLQASWLAVEEHGPSSSRDMAGRRCKCALARSAAVGLARVRACAQASVAAGWQGAPAPPLLSSSTTALQQLPLLPFTRGKHREAAWRPCTWSRRALRQRLPHAAASAPAEPEGGADLAARGRAGRSRGGTPFATGGASARPPPPPPRTPPSPNPAQCRPPEPPSYWRCALVWQPECSAPESRTGGGRRDAARQ